MSIHIDKYGRAYTTDKETAMKYRVKDEQIQYHRLKKWLPEYDKYVSLYYYDRKEKIYRLPPSCGRWNIKSWIWEHKQVSYYDCYDGWQYSVAEFTTAQKDAIIRAEWDWRAKIICGSPSIWKSFILWAFACYTKRKSIVVVPTKTIWDWLYDKFSNKIFTDKDDVIILDAAKIRKDPDILNKYFCVIITRASLHNIRDIINDYDKYKFDQFLFDEAHYLWPSMQEMVNTFKGQSIVWVTATPRRKELTDEQFELYFSDKINVQWSVLPMRIRQYNFKYEMPIEEYIRITKDCKDPTAPEVLRTMTNECEKRIELIKDITADRLLNKNVVLLLVDRIEELNKYKEFFPDAILIWGWNKWEAELVKALENRNNSTKILIIWTAQTCWTGFDYPEINSVILTFSTRWRNSIEQYAGRSRRSNWPAKEAWEMCDIQDSWKINNQHRYFWSKERNEIYKDLWYTVLSNCSLSYNYTNLVNRKPKHGTTWQRYC